MMLRVADYFLDLFDYSVLQNVRLFSQNRAWELESESLTQVLCKVKTTHARLFGPKWSLWSLKSCSGLGDLKDWISLLMSPIPGRNRGIQHKSNPSPSQEKVLSLRGGCVSLKIQTSPSFRTVWPHYIKHLGSWWPDTICLRGWNEVGRCIPTCIPLETDVSVLYYDCIISRCWASYYIT